MEAVELALALAMDGSASVDREEWGLMLGGTAAAFRDPAVQAALPPRGVACALMAWSGSGQQDVAIGWTRLGNARQMEAFADLVDAVPRVLRPGATALGEALSAGLALLARVPAPAARFVVDVAGDGRSNAGLPPAPVRDRAADAGIGINALAVLNEEADLLDYYVAEVIGGPGAFALPALDYGAFAQAMTEKLRREFAPRLLA
jgi:hypothetical protein